MKSLRVRSLNVNYMACLPLVAVEGMCKLGFTCTSFQRAQANDSTINIAMSTMQSKLCLLNSDYTLGIGIKRSLSA